MENDLINLLPAERQRVLSREYFIRFGVMAAFLITLLVVAAGILLLPTYVFLVQSATAKQARLTNVEAILSSSNEAALSARLTALSNEAAQLIALGSAPSASDTIRTALAIPRPGIALSGFEYARAAGKVPGTLEISGVATTRDALRTYQLALQNSSFAAAADLPVSAYAKDANIIFTIVVTLAP
jgi:hypothetical protein